jgi:pyridinium-3,5-bisthiocarboxylic acid mononucleotide nickel chelatase
MRVLHFDCFSGISGDMTLAALIDAGLDVDALRAGLDSLGLPIALETEKVKRNGFAATYVHVAAPEQDDHRFLPEIEAIIAKGNLPETSRQRALAIFRKLAEAEAAAHGMPVEKVHFHEVGALDSIADIVGVSLAFDLLGIERITCRSVPPGSGSVKCAHGLMPVPTPATAYLLKGMPLATAPVSGELVTPTGAAILATVVAEFTQQPLMTIRSVGHGAGKRDPWELPNILRVFLGEANHVSDDCERDNIVLLETNLDDVSGEVIGYTFERLFAAGALDVFTQAIQMKKNRPGVILSVVCEPGKCDEMEAILFRETGTFGIRRSAMPRSKRTREIVVVETPFGPVRFKRGIVNSEEVATPEYDDLARIARETGRPLNEVEFICKQNFMNVKKSSSLHKN